MSAHICYGPDLVGVVVVVVDGETLVYSVEVEEETRGVPAPVPGREDLVYEDLTGSPKWVATLESGRALCVVEGNPVAFAVTAAGAAGVEECSTCGGSGRNYCADCGEPLAEGYVRENGGHYSRTGGELFEDDDLGGDDYSDALAPLLKAYNDATGVKHE